MAPPPWVLIDRRVVRFVRGEEPVNPGKWRGRDYEEIVATVTKTMKPAAAIVDPPGVSHLSMVRQIDLSRLSQGIISCSDKALVLLYIGSPCVSRHGYLVYDACSDSISTIPALDSNYVLGRAAILSIGGEGAYVVAELVGGFDELTLYLWWSRSKRRRWVRSAARIPPQLCFTPAYRFTVDMAFAYAGSSVCWVDLLAGVLICDLFKSPEPEFRFVPLPDGSIIDVPLTPCEGRPVGRPRPEEFRTMGCVAGAIKSVSLVGLYERRSPCDMVLETWTLSRDLNEWEQGKPLPVADLWAGESFRERGLPQLTPGFPVLSKDDAEVVCVAMNDIDYEKRVNDYGEVRPGNMVHKAHYMLCLNTVQNRVLSFTHVIPDNFRPHFPDVLATEFSAYLYRTNKGPASNLKV